ncbi:sulfite exporter TauE/SafE family protein [Candidatus Dojkabacteria bacterium]|uniref:Sulfite exporter TauE/SafE family protein n=1 Tax=Candidatus Dojkabacteria bacterium TaxID=2099670 RepID=A0A955L7Q0_9BACT|nr:sulfite exporter TauE/SafE family protein [Candidatus Dojkabacteria bacterium]
MQKKSKSKQCTLFIDGMHCPSCELLVEKKLLKRNSIKQVDASLKNSRVQISYSGSEPNIEDINKEFKELGYTFSTKKFKVDNKPAISFKGGNLEINPRKLKSLSTTVLAVIVLILGFFAFEGLQLGQYVSVDANSSLPAFFLLGIVAGLSSCAALIGGLLLSMVKQWNELYIGETDTKKAQPHILFHVGRLVSFAVFGALLGVIGDVISLDNSTVYAILVFAVSVIMLVLALQMLGVTWAQKLSLRTPKGLGIFIADEKNFKGEYMPLIVGGLTFFLPCGFTLIAQGIALASGDPLAGSLIMLIFALGTLPTLAAISFSGLKFNKKPHLTARFNQIAGFIIIFFVIYNINGQMNVLGLPSLSDIEFKQSEQTVIENATQDNTLDFVAKGFEYIPSGPTTLQSGTPAKLKIDNQGILGCGSFVASRGLFDGFVSLQPGMNEIDLGIVQPGSYKLTCSMGMVPPVTITVI